MTKAYRLALLVSVSILLVGLVSAVLVIDNGRSQLAAVAPPPATLVNFARNQGVATFDKRGAANNLAENCALSSTNQADSCCRAQTTHQTNGYCNGFANLGPVGINKEPAGWKAVDTYADTMWCSRNQLVAGENDWFAVDLKQSLPISKIVIDQGTSSPTNLQSSYSCAQAWEYRIETSVDKVTWTPVASTTDTLSTKTVNLSTPKWGRYVRIFSTRTPVSYGRLSVKDFQVWGVPPTLQITSLSKSKLSYGDSFAINGAAFTPTGNKVYFTNLSNNVSRLITTATSTNGVLINATLPVTFALGNYTVKVVNSLNQTSNVQLINVVGPFIEFSVVTHHPTTASNLIDAFASRNSKRLLAAVAALAVTNPNYTSDSIDVQAGDSADISVSIGGVVQACCAVTNNTYTNPQHDAPPFCNGNGCFVVESVPLITHPSPWKIASMEAPTYIGFGVSCPMANAVPLRPEVCEFSSSQTVDGQYLPNGTQVASSLTVNGKSTCPDKFGKDVRINNRDGDPKTDDTESLDVRDQCGRADDSIAGVVKIIATYKDIGGDKILVTAITDTNHVTRAMDECRKEPKAARCKHKEFSCHYGGKGTSDTSYAVDLQGISASETGAICQRLWDAGLIDNGANNKPYDCVWENNDHMHVDKRPTCPK